MDGAAGCGANEPGNDPTWMSKQFVAMAKDAGIVRVAIRIEDDACAACRTLILAYAPQNLPLLPFSNCTRAGGCMCTYVPLPQRNTEASSP